MSIELYLAFVLAASMLILIPRPNVTLLAGRIRPWLRGAAIERLRNKVTGTLLIASGVGLALACRS